MCNECDSFTVDADRQEVSGSFASVESSQPPRGTLDGESVPEGVSQSLLPRSASELNILIYSSSSNLLAGVSCLFKKL